MSRVEDLNNARKKLETSLGDKAKRYFEIMKLWFKMKCTKEDFDLNARQMMTPEQIHLHNDFLLCLFRRCDTLGTITPLPTKEEMKDKLWKNKTKARRRNHAERYSFRPTYLVDFIMRPAPLPQAAYDESQRYCSRELFLPDMSLIYLRMQLAAWETGLEGAEERAALLLAEAVQQFMKNILVAILSHKKGFKVRDKNYMYNVGATRPNPWLRNTANYLKNMNANCRFTFMKEEGEEVNKKLTREEIQRRAAYEMTLGEVVANASSENETSVMTLEDVYSGLQVHPCVIPSHAVYSVNMERILMRLNDRNADDSDSGNKCF